MRSTDILKALFLKWFKAKAESVVSLPGGGSYRRYFRITGGSMSVIGVCNTDLQENRAYFSFTKTFRKCGINVPEIFAIAADDKAYLLQDLGDATLWQQARRDVEQSGCLSPPTLQRYIVTLEELLKIQTQGPAHLDWSYCYPREAFDKMAMLWDLNYFKYFFLRLMRISVDEQKLEDDIQLFSSTLDKVGRPYFLYRDFQSRNIMFHENNPYFIDFQGGKKGALFYDLASLLYDANVELNTEDRTLLFTYYYEAWRAFETISQDEFYALFQQFAAIRLMQALGAFGLRGVVEKKAHFKSCIPYALSCLKNITEASDFKLRYPTLSQAVAASKDLFLQHPFGV